jgi:hypothetical protein
VQSHSRQAAKLSEYFRSHSRLTNYLLPASSCWTRRSHTPHHIGTHMPIGHAAIASLPEPKSLFNIVNHLVDSLRVHVVVVWRRHWQSEAPNCSAATPCVAQRFAINQDSEHRRAGDNVFRPVVLKSWYPAVLPHPPRPIRRRLRQLTARSFAATRIGLRTCKLRAADVTQNNPYVCVCVCVWSFPRHLFRCGSPSPKRAGVGVHPDALVPRRRCTHDQRHATSQNIRP